jgi:ATP-dependent RNA helicase DDX5/DBP2
VVGVAKTGSGKTLGFLMPSFVHILATRKNPRNGPTTLVLAPTRELANQIHVEATKFGRSSGILATCVYGGAPKGGQLREIRNGVQIIIATPGRLNDFLESRQVSLAQVSYLVFDEADRMLDMGFEPQIRKILACIPGQRQTMFYTATWPMGVRKLASEFLTTPCVVYIGDTTKLVANKDITQTIIVIERGPQEKDYHTKEIIKRYQGERVIIFCKTKRMCDQLERGMARDCNCAAIHGDKDQQQRDQTLQNFTSGRCAVMIATDVAARGLDVKGVMAVINYDFPGNVEDYIHRIGRTGRAGAKGSAYLLLSNNCSCVHPRRVLCSGITPNLVLYIAGTRSSPSRTRAKRRSCSRYSRRPSRRSPTS